MKKALFLFVISLPFWNLAEAAMPDPAGTVFIGTTGDPLIERTSVGFVADEVGHIITYISSSPPENLFVFNNINDGTSHRAHKVAYDEISKLLLLQLDGSTENFKPYKFALKSAELQRKVYGINLENEADTRVVTGALASIEEAESDQHPNYYLHNALVGKNNLGGALFNNCGEVVGVIVPKPKLGWFSRTPKGTQYAVPVDWAINKFSTQEWQITRVTDVCLSDAQQAAEKVRLATEAKQVAAAAKEAMEQEAAKKQAELDALKQKSEAEKGASEEERQLLKADIETRKKEAQEASDQATAAQEAHAAAKDAEKKAKEALAEAQDATREREEQYMLWAILGGAVLLFLLLLVWLLKQRTVTRERREKEAAASHAEEVQASLTAREKDEARIRQTPTVFFEGTDSAGQNFALRIPGPSIATAPGAVVGRNPGGSDFILNHPQVSRRQFRLFVDGKLLLIEDLNSTNSTIVDGKKLSGGDATVLVNLSRVELSDLVLTVRLEYNQSEANPPENNDGS